MRGWKSSKTYVEKPVEYKKNTIGVWSMIVACFLYAALLKPVGFIIDSVWFLYFTLCMMTKKENIRWVRFGILAVVGRCDHLPDLHGNFWNTSAERNSVKEEKENE